MAEAGLFIVAPVPFADNVEDKRFKVRPCLVLATAMHGKHKVFLCAPESSQVDKVRGGTEIVLSEEEAFRVGLTKSSVIRFSKCSLVAIMERDVHHKLGHVTDLSPWVQVSIRNAAKSIGCAG